VDFENFSLKFLLFLNSLFNQELFPAFRTRYFLVLDSGRGEAAPPKPKLKNELKQMLQSGLGLQSEKLLLNKNIKYSVTITNINQQIINTI